MDDKEVKEPFLTLDKNGVHIASADVSAALEKKNISASLITGLEGCHARWVFETFVARDILEEQPDNAARRGSLYHKIMEDFFAEPAEKRTREQLNIIANNVLDSEEYADMLTYPEAIQWLKEAIRNYYRMGAKPQQVQVAKIKQTSRDGREYEKNGLEIFVKGNIGGTKRDILGYIDRLVVDQRSLGDKLIIEDWKGLSLDTPLPTMDGWTTMRDVKVGDKLLGTEGVAVNVIAKSKIHHRPCYCLTFSDGSTIVADNEHLWELCVESNDGMKTVVLNTVEINEKWSDNSVHSMKIRNPEPLLFTEKNFVVDPYIFSKNFITILEEEFMADGDLHDDVALTLTEYLRGSLHQRRALLQGFMDAAGVWDASKNIAVFSSTAEKITMVVAEVLCSLGVTPYVSDVNGEHRVSFYPVGFTPFRDETKLSEFYQGMKEDETLREAALHRVLTSIMEVESTPTQCVKVDAENSLYLCGVLYTPTHNTGAKVKRWKKTTKSNDGLGETRQQVIYSMLLEQQGLDVTGARLIYPVAKEIVDVDLTDNEFKDRVLRDVQEADDKLDDLIENNQFDFTPGFLCAWCPLAKICPAAQIKPFKKAQDAYAQQPEAVLLREAIEIQ